MRQLERAGAASESQCVLDAADTVRHNARSQRAGPGSPGPRAAAHQKAEEGSQIRLPTQMQNDLRQLESAGADSDVQCDLDAAMLPGMMAGVSMWDEEVQDHTQQPVGRQRCAEEGSQIPSLTQVQNGMRQLESAGADSDIQCDLDAVDTVRHDGRCQRTGRGGSGLRAAARWRAKLCRRGKSDSLTDTNAEWHEAARKCRSRQRRPV